MKKKIIVLSVIFFNAPSLFAAAESAANRRGFSKKRFKGYTPYHEDSALLQEMQKKEEEKRQKEAQEKAERDLKNAQRDEQQKAYFTGKIANYTDHTYSSHGKLENSIISEVDDQSLAAQLLILLSDKFSSNINTHEAATGEATKK